MLAEAAVEAWRMKFPHTINQLLIYWWGISPDNLSKDTSMSNLTLFLVQWGLTSLSLWVASYIFSGLRFADGGSLLIAALLLGFANAIVKPLLILFTLPLTVVTMGLFLLVINAMVLMLVSAVVSGFTISSFWTAFFASIFISIFSLFVSGLVF